MNKSLTITIDKWGEAQLRLSVPGPLIEKRINLLLQGVPKELGEMWDGDEGVWIDIDGTHCDHGCRISLTMESFTNGEPVIFISRQVGCDPLDGTAEPRLTLDDELAIIKAARLAMGPEWRTAA